MLYITLLVFLKSVLTNKFLVKKNSMKYKLTGIAKRKDWQQQILARTQSHWSSYIACGNAKGSGNFGKYYGSAL